MAEEKAKKPMNPIVKQWIIPIAVLVVICLVCGLLLALCNDLLYIDDDTRLSRSMKKVYPDFELKERVTVNPSNASNSTYGKVNNVYLSTDGTYVIEALGTGGYQGGSVTLYVVIGADALIKGWAVKENVGQSYIDRIPSNAGTTWYVGKDVSNELEKEMTGATVKATADAIQNAVNMAAWYARTVLKLGRNPIGEATNAIEALMQQEGIEVGTFSNSSNTVKSIKVGDKSLSEILAGEETYSYTFIGAVADGSAIAVHVFNWVDDYEYDSLEGIPAGTKIIAVKGDKVVASVHVEEGDELRDRATAYPLQSVGGNAMYAYVTETTDGENNAKVYTVVSLSAWSYPHDYTLTITIETDKDLNVGKVTKIEIATSGFVDGAPTPEKAHALIKGLEGATLATIDELFDSGKQTGATNSAKVITAAVKAALAHYDANLASND